MKTIRKLALSALCLSFAAASYAQTFTVNNLQVNGTQTNTNPLALGSGGTGAATASAARTSLAVPGLATTNTFTVSPQVLSTAAGGAAVTISSAAATSREVNFQTAGTQRWKFQAGNGAESGSNAGSDLAIGRYNDAGTFVDNPLVITRSSGVLATSVRPTFAGNTPWDNGNLSNPASTNVANTFTVSPQTIQTGSGTSALVISGVAATSRELDFQTGANLRWKFQASNAAESGSNVGSDLAVGRYNDAGTFVDNPFVITRSTGLTTIGILTVSGNLTPSQTNGIVGTTTNNNANAGSVGEYTTATNTATALTTATGANCTSVSLTAGDWDVQSVILFSPAATTSITALYSAVNTVSANPGSLGNYTKVASATQVPNNNSVVTSPVVRISLSGTTTVFAVGRADFTVSTMTCDGFIRARRVR